MIPRAAPISGLTWSKVAVVGVQAPSWRNGIRDVDGSCVGICTRDMAHKGGHVEVLCPAVLRDPKPRADAVAVGTFWQVRHANRLPLTLGAIMDGGKNN